MSDSGARWPHWPNLIYWNRHSWFWRYRDGPSPGWDHLRHRPTWKYPHWFRRSPDPGWSGYETWWVLDERACRWVRPTYWGGIGCSCDDGHCCRTCRRGDPNSPNKCAICGNGDICKANLCNHPCCAQASRRARSESWRDQSSSSQVSTGSSPWRWEMNCSDGSPTTSVTSPSCTGVS